jgi:hypothetical protein
MARARTARERTALVSVFVVVALAGSIAGASMTACSSSNSQCNGGTSFLAFGVTQTQSVPFCTTTDDAAVGVVQFEGGTSASFVGAPPLSAAGLAECAALCSQDLSGDVPCCLSQWEPLTVVCLPACQ